MLGQVSQYLQAVCCVLYPHVRVFAKSHIVPDFRSSTGLFSSLKTQHKLKHSGKDLFDASVYKDDSSTTHFHSMVRELSHQTQKAQATPFHHMIATLAEEGRLLRLYTQNVDGIDTSLEPLATTIPLNARGPWPKTVQLHGGLEKMVCTKCGYLSDFKGQLFEGPEPPACPECVTIDGVRLVAGRRSHGVGRLRPRMVLYNEFNPDQEAIGAVSAADLRSRPDAVIVVGTTLKVPGIRRLAREMCAVTRGRRDGFTAWINYDPEPLGVEFKDSWDLVVRGECDEVARHVGLPKWDDKDCGDYRLLTPTNGSFKEAEGSLVGVVLECKGLAVSEPAGILTPGATPRKQSPSITVNISKSKLKQPLLSLDTSKTAIEGEKAKQQTRSQLSSSTPLASDEEKPEKSNEKAKPQTKRTQLPSIVPQAATGKSASKTKAKKPAAPRKSRAKAPARPTKAATNQITNAFGASKVTKSATNAKGSKKVTSKTIRKPASNARSPKPASPPLGPNLIQTKQQPQSPMRPLSPVDRRTNTPSKSRTRNGKEEQQSEQLPSFSEFCDMSDMSHTPTGSRRGSISQSDGPYDREVTVSPTGAPPTGMEKLLC